MQQIFVKNDLEPRECACGCGCEDGSACSTKCTNIVYTLHESLLNVLPREVLAYNIMAYLLKDI